MNNLYILIPIIVLSVAALLIFRPKLLVLNKSHTRYLKPNKSKYQLDIPLIDKGIVNAIKHPPIVRTIHN
jgi:hypothetical protein